jgi:hypothetical protein
VARAEAVRLLAALERGWSLAQAGVISETQFLLFQSIAADALRTVSSIARDYPLTSDEEEAIRTASRRVEGFTVALEADPPAAAGPPWWTWALAALGGAALGAGAIALFSNDEGSRRMSGPVHSRRSILWPALAVMGSGLVVGAAGFPRRESVGGALAIGAGSSAAGAALTLLVLQVTGASPVAA